MIETAFGKRVRYLRKLKNMTQEELAFRSHLNKNYICDIENGRRNVSLRAIEKVAKGLGVEMDVLFIK
jgi:transcriptional regulator with XRE-family HTH domain